MQNALHLVLARKQSHSPFDIAISLDPAEYEANYDHHKHLEAWPRKHSVMRYPCLLTYHDGILTAQRFKEN
jgi:hypothetical protein